VETVLKGVNKEKLKMKVEDGSLLDKLGEAEGK